MDRPLVLLSNDDGFRAPGLHALRAALAEVGDVVVCAPDSEQSASSHSLTLIRPLRITHHGDEIFSVDGTPADCVFVALYAGDRVLPRKPSLVVSGINHGPNLGDDVFYSGTVAAAREGALKGYPALAVSADPEAPLDAAARVATKLAESLLGVARKPLLLNVNFPRGGPWKMVATRLGARRYTEKLEFRVDPRGREYAWLAGPALEHREVAGSDTEAFRDGVVGVTPLELDLWARDQAEECGRVVAATNGDA